MMIMMITMVRPMMTKHIVNICWAHRSIAMTAVTTAMMRLMTMPRMMRLPSILVAQARRWMATMVLMTTTAKIQNHSLQSIGCGGDAGGCKMGVENVKT